MVLRKKDRRMKESSWRFKVHNFRNEDIINKKKHSFFFIVQKKKSCIFCSLPFSLFYFPFYNLTTLSGRKRYKVSLQYWFVPNIPLQMQYNYGHLLLLMHSYRLLMLYLMELHLQVSQTKLMQ